MGKIDTNIKENLTTEEEKDEPDSIKQQEHHDTHGNHNHNSQKNQQDKNQHGHKHTGHNHDHSHHIGMFKKRFFISLILSIPVLILSDMIQSWFGFSIDFHYRYELVFVISTGIYFYGGWPFIKGTFTEIGNKLPGMMTLIGLAISVAYFYSAAAIFFISGKNFFWELATLIDVMLLGHWIEARSVMGASKALDELAALMPKKANLIKNGEAELVDISELKKGDLVLVKPGETIPSDGIIRDGETYIDESMVSGESKPVHKKQGDEVIGGSINGKEKNIKVKIKKTGDDTYLAQVINMVQKARQSKSRTQDTADKAAAALFYVALGAGIITFITWLITNNVDIALDRAVTVMIIACPHALGLAIPLVVAISTAMTAKSGVLIRKRSSFERLKNIEAVIFDKTGTLTKGKFGIDEIKSNSTEDEILKLAAGVEQNSEHILGQAIVEYSKDKGLEIPGSKDFISDTGIGVSAVVNGKRIHLGGKKLLRKLNIDPGQEYNNSETAGKTDIYVTTDDKLLGLISMSDSVRKESYDVIRKLKARRIKVFMLTGDSEAAAGSVAGELGIDDYFSEVMPDEKSDKVREIQEKGLKTAMVGDGINDAPALTQADIGIAIGAGASIAIESADIILVNSNPEDLLKALNYSGRTYSKMVQNLWWAAGYNIIAIPLAAGVLAWAGIIIQPAVGALLMSASTVIVALNAQGLRKMNKKEA